MGGWEESRGGREGAAGGMTFFFSPLRVDGATVTSSGPTPGLIHNSSATTN